MLDAFRLACYDLIVSSGPVKGVMACGRADKPMKRGGKTDNSAAEVAEGIFAVSKGTRANERKKKDQFDYPGKMMGIYLQKPGISLVREGDIIFFRRQKHDFI